MKNEEDRIKAARRLYPLVARVVAQFGLSVDDAIDVLEQVTETYKARRQVSRDH